MPAPSPVLTVCALELDWRSNFRFLPPNHHLGMSMKVETASYDPRGGRDRRDQGETGESKDVDPTGASPSRSDAIQEKGRKNPAAPEKKSTFSSVFGWIPENFTWSQLKPVIRCFLTAWVSLVFIIVRPVARSLGQVSANIQSRALEKD
jgi:hypothetical protein